MILRFHSSKPWRDFSKKKGSIHKIRKICCAALILEAALFIRNFKAAGIHIAKEETRGKIFVEEWQEEEELGILERYIGVRIRLREGVVEFYKREERQGGP